MTVRRPLEGILCSSSHQWVLEVDDYCLIGITEHFANMLGDIVFVELPECGSTFSKNEVFATIESVKTASEIYMPVGGEIIEINEKLINAPETINEDCWGEGWLIKVKSDTFAEDTLGLMEYEDYVEETE